jgi:hypothetical protein
MLKPDPQTISCAGAADCQAQCCTQACTMPAKEGYTTCPQTPLGQPCTVACAQDFSGASTVYKCELVNGQPTFVPQGTEQVCNKIQYARKHASAL